MEKLPRLFFLGQRNYVHAANILRYMLEEIQDQLGINNISEIFVKRFKQIYEVGTPIKIYAEDDPIDNGQVCASLSITVKDQDYTYTIIPVPGTLPRVADEVHYFVDYQEIGPQEASIILPPIADFWVIVKEAVQLAKLFHLKKYNDKSYTYKFMVGGFEKFRYVPMGQNFEQHLISCKITNHALIKGTIYNMNLISVKSNSENFSFNLAFIGKGSNS
jgi:hypothetical protein